MQHTWEQYFESLINYFGFFQERRQANATVDAEIGSKTVYKTTKASAKMLWKAFKLAFWVYTYAGGQDDRADRLTKQLAQEIENDPEHKCNILY